MKKIFLSIALCAMMALATTSCSKSNTELLDDYRKIGTEVVEAMKAGDMSKVESLCKKGEKLEKELSERNLTAEEKAELAKIEYEIANNATSAATDMVNDAAKSFGF